MKNIKYAKERESLCLKKTEKEKESNAYFSFQQLNMLIKFIQGIDSTYSGIGPNQF